MADVQLITEQFLRRQLDIKVTRDWALVIAEMFCGPTHKAPSRVLTSADTWDDDHTVKFTVVLNDAPGVQRHFRGEIVFGGPNYDTGAGDVLEGKCHRLPGGGQQSTGEYQTFDNVAGSQPLAVSKGFNVTESTASSITVSESLEMSSGTTIEAGEGVAKVSAELSTTFGISKDETNDQAYSEEKTLQLDFEVPVPRVIAIAGAVNNSAMDCEVKIGAPGDWASILVIISPPDSSEFPGHYWDRLPDVQPTTYANQVRLMRGTLVDYRSHGWARMTFDQSDAVYRAAMGYDVRNPYPGEMQYSAGARAALARMSDAKSRWISFEGVRHSTAGKDAEYKEIDVTGIDPDDVADVLGHAGTPVGELNVRLGIEPPTDYTD